MTTTTTDTDDYLYINSAETKWHWRTRLTEIYEHRYLLRNLVTRELKARYKNSILGVLWSLLNPLGMMLVFTALFTVLNGGVNAYQHYPVFILVGLLPWNFFSGSLSSGTTAIIGNDALIKKVYFPRELLPLASLISQLVNFGFAFILLVIFIYVYDIGLTVHALWVPVILLAQLIFTLGLSFLLSAVTVYFRDILLILDVILTAWFFLTPIFYAFDFFSAQADLLGLTFDPARVMRWVNPMASIIDAYRTVLWGTTDGAPPASMDLEFILRTFLTTIIVFIIGYAVFVKLEPKFGEKL